MSQSQESDKEVLKKIEVLTESLEQSIVDSRKDWKKLDKMIVINNGNQIYGDVSSFDMEKVRKHTLELVNQKETYEKINKLLSLEDDFVFNKNTYEYWLSLFQKRAKEINLYNKISKLDTLKKKILTNDYEKDTVLEEANQLIN